MSLNILLSSKWEWEQIPSLDKAKKSANPYLYSIVLGILRVGMIAKEKKEVIFQVTVILVNNEYKYQYS